MRFMKETGEKEVRFQSGSLTFKTGEFEHMTHTQKNQFHTLFVLKILYLHNTGDLTRRKHFRLKRMNKNLLIEADDKGAL